MIPLTGLAADFFRLQTRVAIVGDISNHLNESQALRDFVGECNRGRQIWLATSMGELEARLSAPSR